MKNFTFIDLFAGIGGFRIALERLGGKCIFSSEWDKYAQVTYEANFNEKPKGDITQIKENDIPFHDVLCAGFPCQPFSIAGVSKKNSLGIKHGFDDEKQGNLFFEIIRIAKYHKTPILFLENVKNIKSHDSGKTWQVIKNELENAGYSIFFKVVDSSFYVPQKRQRVFIVCFLKSLFPNIDFHFPEYPKNRAYELKDILIDEVDQKYTLSNHLWTYLQNRKIKNKELGKGFGYGLFNSESEYVRTISARYYKDGSEVLIEQKNKNPRRLTPKECSLLQGFSSDFIIPVSDNQAYKQFGNTVVVTVVESIFKSVLSSVDGYRIGLNKKQDTLIDIMDRVS